MLPGSAEADIETDRQEIEKGTEQVNASNNPRGRLSMQRIDDEQECPD